MVDPNKYEEKKKDEIIQAFIDEAERQDWGGDYDKVTIKIILRGKLNLQPIEVDIKQKRKS